MREGERRPRHRRYPLDGRQDGAPRMHNEATVCPGNAEEASADLGVHVGGENAIHAGRQIERLERTPRRIYRPRKAFSYIVRSSE